MYIILNLELYICYIIYSKVIIAELSQVLTRIIIKVNNNKVFDNNI